MENGIFKGLKVIDCASFIAGEVGLVDEVENQDGDCQQRGFRQLVVRF